MTEPPRQFASEDVEAQHWLGILKDGPNQQKVAARLGLAAIFERRGMPAEATELLVSCIGAGHRDSDTYEWLARLHAAQGRKELSVRARAEARQLRVRQAADRASATPVAELPAPAGTLPLSKNRGRALLYVVGGILVTVGGYIVASTYGEGTTLLLYGLPIAGVALLARGLVALIPRSSR
ncbi:MAG: hypothetical protein AB7P40_31480 [Chloroflexota bacterium]